MDAGADVVMFPEPLEAVFQGEIGGFWRTGRIAVLGWNERGGGAVLSADFEMGMGIALLISFNLGGSENINLMGQIHWCRPSSEPAVFEVYLIFDNISKADREMMGAFVQEGAGRLDGFQAGRHEKRKFVRVGKSLEVEYQIYSNNIWAQGKGEMETLDIGGGGVKLRTSQALEENNFIYMNIPLRGQETFYSMGKVVWAHPVGDGGHYEAGIKFVDVPQAEQERVIRFVQHELLEKV